MTDRHAGMAIDLSVHQAAKRRLNKFLNLPCASRLLASVRWGLDPMKEITESMAVWEAVRRWARYRGVALSDRSIRALVVGDGRSPRTGALLALTLDWQVTSIDPALRGDPQIDRLTVVPSRLEERPDLRADFVLAVHSHATVEATRRAGRGGTVISLPCCVPWPIHDGCETWIDDACLSPDRRVVVERP